MIHEERKHLPPYVSYKTFAIFLDELQQYLPTRIDRSYWSEKFSSNTGSHLMSAMRFLNLIDVNNRPTSRLKLLVLNSTGEHRAILLRQVADEAYAFVFKGELDTQTATYTELEAVFQNTYRIDYDICHKCIRFFIDFCKDASIPLSPQLTPKHQNPRTRPGIKNTTDKRMNDDLIEGGYGEIPSDNRLQQVKFLHILAKDFKHFDRMYLKARQTLKDYEKIPAKMTREEWQRVWVALSEYYESVKFLYRIALLAESRIIDMDLLYIFYYADIVENTILKLNRLIKWCGTGLDLAANYTSYELARIGITLVNLIEKLNIIHEEHGADLVAEGNSVFIEQFKVNTKDFFSNPGKFYDDSPNTISRIVAIGKGKKSMT